MTFRARVERLYRVVNHSESAHGAGTWLARQLNVQPNTVYKWMKGERTPSGPAMRTVELLEREHGVAD